MFKSPFHLEAKEYKREVNPIQQYKEQSSTYLNIMTGKSYDECFDFVTRTLQENKDQTIVNPKVVYLERNQTGDREQKETTLTEYLHTSLREGDLIAPTLTTYINPKIKESLLVNYVEDNIAGRSKAKKAEFAAKAAGQKDKAKIFNLEQTNKKLRNNALSGAHVSASTPLYNKTAHSTLTSTCRNTSGFGNANNEKFLNGNRHYWSNVVVLNNICSIVSNTDYLKFERTIAKYNIVYPSVKDVMDCITYSSDLYWTDRRQLVDIQAFVDKLSPIQRAAFVYTGDMYHLMKLNPNIIRGFISELIVKVTGEFPNALETIGKINSVYVDLAHQICLKEMMGKGKDYKSMENTVELQTLVLTSINIGKTLDKYSDLIRTFWVTNNVPASVAYFPESQRRSAITSDTDSTIFSVQDWVLWYTGKIGFDQEAISVAAVMIFLASQSITHVLAMMSANFGISEKRIFQIAMKNEFKFDVFCVTNVAKHYMAKISVQEGNVFDHLETEIKGVHLKSSNAPKSITNKAAELMEFIMNSVIEGKKISILKVLKDVADTERNIIASVLKGETEYFRFASIKSAESYTKEERESPYIQYLLWKEVFSDKYGSITEPPYSCIKIPTMLDKPANVTTWLEQMPDKELSNKITKWLTSNSRTVLPTINLSVDIIKSIGIPAEIQAIINTRRIVTDLCNIFYIILEVLGFYLKEGQMVSDHY